MTEKRGPGRPRKDDVRDPVSEAREPEGRRKRVPMGQMQLKMDAPKRDGFHRHWAADRKQNLQRYLNAGYEYVTDEPTIDEAGSSQTSRVSIVSGTLPDGGPEYSYLMEIPQHLYDEDQAAKNADLDEIDETLRRGHVRGADAKDNGAFYRGSGRGDIVIETTDGSR